MKTLVIVPTFNEARNIITLLKQATSAVPEAHFLVVDDNSPDNTACIVQTIARTLTQVNLLSRTRKEGLALAYLAGFRWGLERGYEVLIQMDADLSHSPQYLPQFCLRLQNADAVFGARYLKGGGIEGWGPLRQAISRGGNLYAQTVLGLPYADLTGGFNGWHRRVLEHIGFDTIRSRGYAFQVELKYRAHLSGFSLTELPILFKNRVFGKSKMTGRIVYEAAYRVWQMRLGTRPRLPLYESAPSP